MKKILRFRFLSVFIIWLALFGGFCLYLKAFQYSQGNTTYKSVLYENESIKSSEFDTSKINTKIKELIKSFNIKDATVTYEISIIDNKYLNILFKLPNYCYQSYLLNLKDAQELSMNKIVHDYEVLIEKSYKMLELKYPKFILDAIKKGNGIMAYLIKENEMVIYFSNYKISPQPQEDLFIKLNYHEISDYLEINYILDSEYINQNVYTLDSNKPTIAFTFDDGPSGSTTKTLIEILKENKATATFFMLGNRMNNNHNLVKKVLSYNNEIGSHSYSHKYLAKIKKNAMIEEITKTNAVYKNITGEDISLFRPPYWSVNENVRKNSTGPLIRWSVDPQDWKYKDAEVVKNRVLNAVKDGDIVLMHDIHKTSVEAVRMILPELYVRGYQVVTVSKLAELKNKTLENNLVYSAVR